MTSSNNSDTASISPYDVNRIVNLTSDPIKLGIILEIIRNPDVTTNELKKRLNIPGSRIYYFLNQLVDNGIIEESGTEQLTKTLSRRKFRISNWFERGINSLRYDEEEGHSKVVHLFQLHFAIAILNQQVRTLEKIPDSEFDTYFRKLDLPDLEFYFLDENTLSILKSKHKEVSTQMSSMQENGRKTIDFLKKSSYISLFGIYLIE
ncbi:MAG: winged helix-turn-helix transcriptional regulator [Promethearchaeota archaeon]